MRVSLDAASRLATNAAGTPPSISMPAPVALAVFAHPDDIEFVAAGTLLLLGQAGWQTHYLTLSGGDCGSMTTDRDETRRIRTAEGRAAAAPSASASARDRCSRSAAV